MIRRAHYGDVPFIMELVREFNDRFYPVPLNEKKTEDWVDRVFDAGIILVSEHGLIAGFPVDDPVRDQEVLVENAWYSRGRDGAALLRAFIKHARDNDYDEVRMTTLSTTPKGVDTLLERMGFKPLEVSHSLNL